MPEVCCEACSCHASCTTGGAVCWRNVACKRSCCDEDRHLAEVAAATVARADCPAAELGCAVETERAMAAILGTAPAAAFWPAAAASAATAACKLLIEDPRLEAAIVAGASTDCGGGADVLAPSAQTTGAVAGVAGVAMDPPTTAADNDLVTEAVTTVFGVAVGAAGVVADAPGAAAEERDLATAEGLKAHAGVEATFILNGTADSRFAPSTSTDDPKLLFEGIVDKVGFDGALCRREDAGGEAEGAMTRVIDGARAQATGDEVRCNGVCTGVPGMDAKDGERKHVEFGLDRATGECAAPMEGCRAEALRCTTRGDCCLHARGEIVLCPREHGDARDGEETRASTAWATAQRGGATSCLLGQRGLQRNAGNSPCASGAGDVFAATTDRGCSGWAGGALALDSGSWGDFT